jgi:hypothetical protein
MASEGGGQGQALLTVHPHGRRDRNGKSLSDRLTLQLFSDRLVAVGGNGKPAQFPVGAADTDPLAVRRMVLTKFRNADRAGDGYTRQLELLNAQHQVVCVLPGVAWDNGELSSLCRQAGISFATDDLPSIAAHDKGYPTAHGVARIYPTGGLLSRLSVRSWFSSSQQPPRSSSPT